MLDFSRDKCKFIWIEYHFVLCHRCTVLLLFWFLFSKIYLKICWLNDKTKGIIVCNSWFSLWFRRIREFCRTFLLLSLRIGLFFLLFRFLFLNCRRVLNKLRVLGRGCEIFVDTLDLWGLWGGLYLANFHNNRSMMTSLSSLVTFVPLRKVAISLASSSWISRVLLYIVYLTYCHFFH